MGLLFLVRQMRGQHKMSGKFDVRSAWPGTCCCMDNAGWNAPGGCTCVGEPCSGNSREILGISGEKRVWAVGWATLANGRIWLSCSFGQSAGDGREPFKTSTDISLPLSPAGCSQCWYLCDLCTAVGHWWSTWGCSSSSRWALMSVPGASVWAG